MKKICGAIIALIILPVAWYLLSPLFISVELNEPSPIDQQEEFVESRNASESPKVLLQGNFI